MSFLSDIADGLLNVFVLLFTPILVIVGLIGLFIPDSPSGDRDGGAGADASSGDGDGGDGEGGD